jgi:hypothetical protein
MDERTQEAVLKALGAAARVTGRGALAAGRVSYKLTALALRTMRDRARTRRAARVHESEFVSPFDGKPRTRMVEGKDGGIAAVVIEPVILTPFRAKVADFLGGVSAFALAGLSLGVVDLFHRPAWYVWALPALWVWPFCVDIQNVFRRFFFLPASLTFTPGQFSVRVGDGRTVVYDRLVPHRFRLDNRHRKAREEAERSELIEARARSRGRFIRKTKYYRETFHLVIDYRGQPKKVMELMGQDEAQLVLARVKTVDEVMDQVVKQGSALPKGPQSEWDDMAGKIPEKV